MKIKVLIVLLLTGIALLSAGVVVQEFSFTEPAFTTKDGFDKLTMENLVVITKPGAPELPMQSVQMLLPPGEEAVSVQISYGRAETLTGTYNVYPIQKPYPMSYEGEIEFVYPVEEIYSQNAFYPRTLFADLTTQYLRGHSIGLLNISPLQYNPQTGEIIFYRNLTVTIKTQITATSQRAYNNFYRGDEKTQIRLAKLVSNPENITFYPPAENTRDIDDFEYIIVAPNQYLAELTPFIEFKTSQGYHVFTKTTEDIYIEYTGSDIADQIRNFIIDAYQNMGAENVLLVGDIGQVPHRGFWVNAGGTEDFNIPSELYYEGLDRVGTGTGPDWNTDGDNIWAETSEADYYSEVNVGRISAGNTTELAAAVNKQIMYQDNPVVDQLETALMVGEELNNSPYTYGGDYKDEIVTGGTFNGYSTVGIDPNITVNTLYERDGYWGVSQLQNHMNNGLNFLNHLGHSNTDYNMKFYNSTVNNQTITANGIDNNFFLIYSQGCLPAAINTDCIAEKFTTIDNGCVAFIGNTRYGWYMPGGTNSSSQYMDRQFWDALFDEDITQISAMNTDSKEDGAAQCNSNPWFRWSYYCLIVLGDPTLDVWTETPVVIDAIYQPSISIGASEIPFQTDAPYARIGLMQDGELIGRAVADENGDVLLETFEQILTAEEITVSIIGHNKTRHLGNMVVISNEPFVIVETYEVNDPTGNGNNLPDYDESITLDMTLQNLGNQLAENITATISTDDIYITITDDNADFGNIAIQGNITVTDAFAMDIPNNVPDQHVVTFLLEATNGTREIWTSQFELIINAPEFEATMMQVIDTSGNNNGIIDPGETVTIIIPTQNIGHTLSPMALAALVTNNALVTIENTISDLGAIEAGASSNAIYTVTADASIDVGTPVEFNLTIIAGSYVYENVFMHQIGLILENFETGDFSAYPWEFSGSADWEISAGAYEGTYCAKSGAIGNSTNSTLKIEIDVAVDGQVSFWRTVSSEVNYDYLQFHIDGTMQNQWSGDVTWEEEIYAITAGNHILEWKYVKDQAVTGGTDCARVDYIIFPPLGVIFPPIMTVNPSILNVELLSNTISEEIIEIGNIGGEILTYTISFTNSPDWLTVDPITGDVISGEIDEVTLTFDTTDLTAGQYNTALLIDDGIGGQIIVPVSLLVTGTGNGNDLIPMRTELYGNHPNPFNPSTTINYGLNTDSRVALNIYNVRGQKVVTLVNESQNAGYHQVHWSGFDDANKKVTSGIYFFELDVEEGDYTSIKKMILLK